MSQPISNLNKRDLLKNGTMSGGILGSIHRFIEIIQPDDLNSFSPIVDHVRIELPLSFKPDTGSHFWYHTKNTGEVISESAGARGGGLFRNRIAFTVPGNAPEVLDQVQAMLDKPIIAIGKDLQGRKRIVGTKLRPAYAKVKTTTGNSRTGRAGNTFTIEAYSPNIALLYDVEGAYNVNPDGFNFKLSTIESAYTEI